MHKTILYVNACGDISGAERSLLAMLDALDRSRWMPVVAAPGGPLLDEVERRGIAHAAITLPPMHRPHTLAQGWALWRAVNEGRKGLARVIHDLAPDLIHANTTSAMLHLPRRVTAPIIWQIRDLVPLNWLGPSLYRRAARVAVISSAVREQIRRYAPDGGEKISLLPPAVDTEHFRPIEDRRTTREALGLPGDAFLIGLVAQFVPWKRHHLFLDALEVIEGPWHAVLVGADLHGDAAYLAGIRERIAHPPLAGRVTWLPWQEDSAPLLSTLDICALTSRAEPFGRVLVEAMACGTPVVAVDDGGVRDIVSSDTGILSPAEPTALAAAFRRLMDDAALRTHLAAAGRAHAIAHFSLPTHRATLNALYAQLI